MHNHFLDKKRRHINLRTAKVGGVLPEHFAAAYPKFISLLEHYYEFMDSDGSSTEMLNHLFAARDINETELDLLSFIEDELLLGGSYFQGFANQDATPQEREAQLRAAANFSNIMFRSKGTRFAIEWFFRSFYGIDAEVVYPKENIFKVGDVNSRIGADSLRYLTNDELYQTFALLVRVGVPISQWKDLFKLFVHPAGMYLAGEVLLEDTVQSLVSTRMDDSAVSQRITSSYSIGVSPSDSEDEGTLFKFTVSGTNVPDNTDALYYYVDHISTSDSDFVSPPPSILSPLYFEVNDSAGTAVGKFSIPTRTDSDEAEGVEQFNVFLIDDENRVKGQSLINLNDVVSSYVITPSSATPSEGDIITFDVAGTDVPNNGNTTLYYYVTHGTTSDSDFTVVPPMSTAAQPFSILNSNGSFSLRTMVDNVVDDNETFTVSLQTEASGGIAKGSVLITVSDTIPTFDLTVDDPVEGNPLLASLSVDSTTIGDTVNWSVTGAAASDSRLLSSSGSFTITGANDTYLLSNTTSLLTYQGPTAGTVSFTSDLGFTDNDTFDILDQAPVYTITPSSLISTEGDSVSYEIGGTNIPDSDVNFYINFGETSAADFVGTVPQSGSPDTITMSGGVSSPSPLLQFATNGDLDPETFTAVVETTTGTELATLDYTIAGNRVYQLSLDSDNLEIDESKTVQTVSFLTTDSDGTYYYWFQGNNVDSGDFISGFAPVTAKQSFTVSTNYGTIFADLNQDLLREGTETYKVLVSKTAGGGALAESPTITILDTSIPTYTVNASDQVEGLSVPVVITVDRAQSEVVNAKITGPSDLTNRLVVTEKTKMVSGSPDYLFFDTTSDSAGHGDLTGTVTLRLDSANGLFLASDTFVLSDEASAYSLTTDLANDSANEGDTINFTFDGTNITDGTYHYRTSNMYPVRTDQVVPQGTFFIYLEDTSNLALGMESNTSDIPGTIVSISPGSGVTMSSAVPLSSLPVGYDFHFAQPEVFDDFDAVYEASGTFSVASNNGTFRVDVAEDGDLSDESYTFGVYDSHLGSLLASRLVSINDTSLGDLVQFSSKPTGVSKTDNTSSVTAEIQFRSDGKYYGSFATVTTSSYTYNASTHYWEAIEIDPGDYEVTVVWDGVTVIDAEVFIDYEPSQLVGINDNKYLQGTSQGGGRYAVARRTEGMEQLGTWLNPTTSLPGDAGDYRIRATKSNEFGSPTFTGSFGTWELLSSLRGWTVRVVDNNVNAGADFVFEIQKVSDAGNSDSWSLTFEAFETYNSGGRSGSGSSTGGDDDAGTDVALH
jgi:hypothetical protein